MFLKILWKFCENIFWEFFENILKFHRSWLVMSLESLGAGHEPDFGLGLVMSLESLGTGHEPDLLLGLVMSQIWSWAGHEPDFGSWLVMSQIWNWDWSWARFQIWSGHEPRTYRGWSWARFGIGAGHEPDLRWELVMSQELIWPGYLHVLWKIWDFSKIIFGGIWAIIWFLGSLYHLECWYYNYEKVWNDIFEILRNKRTNNQCLTASPTIPRPSAYNPKPPVPSAWVYDCPSLRHEVLRMPRLRLGIFRLNYFAPNFENIWYF